MKRHLLLISVSLFVFFGLAIGYDYYLQDQSRLDRYARKIERFLHQQESDAHTLLMDAEFWYRFTTPMEGSTSAIHHLSKEKANAASIVV